MIEEATTPTSEQSPATPAYRIRVCGLGGAGGNVVQSMLAENLEGFETLVVNTDAQALESIANAETLWLGRKVTRGCGTGGVLATGEKIAAEERAAFDAMVEGVDCLISVTGMGGGTGTAFVDALAAAAVRADVLHLAFVFHPFSFEGSGRARLAEEASGKLRAKVHGLVLIPNDLILQSGGEQVSALEAFDEANRWIVKALRALGLMIFKPGLMRQDLASLAVTLGERGGRVLFGLGEGRGEDPVKTVLKNLLQCPFLAADAGRKMDQLLIQVTGGPGMGMAAVQRLIATLREHFECRESIRFGATIDVEAGEAMRVCVFGKTEIGRVESAPVADNRDPSLLQSAVPATGNGKMDTPVHDSKIGKRAARKIKAEADSQKVFDFMSDNSVQRGLFEQSERNFRDGEDLDVPTYLRKGVRIRVL